jgi:hypothetical protein
MMVRALVLAFLALWGCATRRPAPEPPLLAYANAGTLQVRGARASAPGPSVVRALRDEPRAARVLALNGTPDALEVSGVPGTRRVVLFYDRAGGRRRVVVSLDSPAASATASSRTRQASARRRVSPPSTSPTATQNLECPIDPGRSDCRALCAGGSRWEWCP